MVNGNLAHQFVVSPESKVTIDEMPVNGVRFHCQKWLKGVNV